MNLKKIRSALGRHWHNIPGWRTNRKIVVIESDDWGSIRMPSREVYEKLLRNGIAVDKLSFTKYDSLASEEDLEALFDVLRKHKDQNGKNPIITANTVMANPDFEKIKLSNYTEYHYELFTETLKRYPKHQNSFKIWKEGIASRLFHPQFHGREHLNVPRWLDALQRNKGNVRLAFENSMFDLSDSGFYIGENSFMDALAYNNNCELETSKESLRQGLELFESVFGYRSLSFIASCYIWALEQEQVLASRGVKYIQGAINQKAPIPGMLNKYEFKKHFTGQQNNLGQLYLVRNCFFEPSEGEVQSSVSDCMKRVSTAFFWEKPAIISSHRLNYIGSIFPENRKNGLFALHELLTVITKRHPEVEFMTTPELGLLIGKNLKKNC